MIQLIYSDFIFRQTRKKITSSADFSALLDVLACGFGASEGFNSAGGEVGTALDLLNSSSGVRNSNFDWG